MSTASPTEDSSDRKQLLAGLKENCAVLKKLVSTAEDFIECTSFICSNTEISQIKQEMKSFMNHTAKIQETFEEFNCNLYNLATDSDVFPTAEQDTDFPVETETFKEKRELSDRVIKKTITYLQNPIYMYSTINILLILAASLSRSSFSFLSRSALSLASCTSFSMQSFSSWSRHFFFLTADL